MSENEKTAKLENWQKAGLPGRPYTGDGTVQEDVDAAVIITHPNGKPILTKKPYGDIYHATEAISGYLGRKIEAVFFHDGDSDGCLDGVYGFALPKGGPRRSLSLSDRAAVAALADYFGRYFPGLRLDEPARLPRLLYDESDLSGGYLTDTLDERRAYMLADVACETFGLRARVIEDGNGWVVLLDDEAGNGYVAGDTMAMLQGVCRALADFTVSPAEPAEEPIPAPELREARRAKAKAEREEMFGLLADIRDRLARLEAAGVAAENVLASV